MTRIFLDANVIFSGSNPGSALHQLVRVISEKAIPITSDFALQEVIRNISVKRPAWKSTFDSVLPLLQIVPSTTFPLPVDLATKDIPILCAAIKAKANFLVTGDKRDFGHLYDISVMGVKVLWPDAMAKELLKSGR